jgi:hypothetical protein
MVTVAWFRESDDDDPFSIWIVKADHMSGSEDLLPLQNKPTEITSAGLLVALLVPVGFPSGPWQERKEGEEAGDWHCAR